MTLTFAADRVADLLLRSRDERAPLSALPSDLTPATIADAYAVQDATLRRLGAAGGWKVGPKPTGEPACAALPARAFHPSGARLDVPPAGFEVEVETAFVMARDLPPRGTPYTETEVSAAIGALHLAVELLSSRFRDRKSQPPLASIADLQSNDGVIVGDAITDWRGVDLGALPLTLDLDDRSVDLPRNNHSLATVLHVVTWLANHAAARGLPLKAGDVVITGARLGPVPLGEASTITARCPDLGEVRAEFLR